MRAMLPRDEPVLIWTGKVNLEGRLSVPSAAPALALIASLGGAIDDDAYRRIGTRFGEARFATLRIDLLTDDERQFDSRTSHFRFDVFLLSQRILAVTRWLSRQQETRALPVAFFGCGPVGAAALAAAGERQDDLSCIIAAGTPTLLAAESLPRIAVPTLLLAADGDVPLLRMNREALEKLKCDKRLQVIRDTTRLLSDGRAAVESIASYAVAWASSHVLVPVAEEELTFA